uniref:hypothetical protein n=1 Tax=uncultured Sphingomonas sp. TaxID=158754 RepID=UPI0035CAA060
MTDTARSATLLWILLFTVASTLTTLVFACATPFPSLAALAAIHMNRRDGVLLMLAAWVVSQAVGFCFLGYPWDAATALTGFAIGTAAVTGVVIASLIDARLRNRATLLRLVVAYLAAFATFKLTIMGWAPIMGHADAALSGTVLLRQFVRYAAVLIGLYALYRALTAAGLPAVPQRTVVA